MRKIKYWIIDTLSAFAIRYDFKKLESWCWEVKQMQIRQWYGEQSGFPVQNPDFIELAYYLLHKGIDKQKELAYKYIRKFNKRLKIKYTVFT